MFKNLFKIKELVKKLLLNQNYFLIFFFVTLFSFGIFYILTVSTVANQDLRILIMMSGFWYTITDLFLLLIIAILFGVFVSLFVYKFKMSKKISKSGFFGTFGLTTGLFSAGCPTCGAFLFMLLGMPLALIYFPFKGLELKVLSVILLSISIYIISNKLTKCKTK